MSSFGGGGEVKFLRMGGGEEEEEELLSVFANLAPFVLRDGVVRIVRGNKSQEERSMPSTVARQTREKEQLSFCGSTRKVIHFV